MTPTKLLYCIDSITRGGTESQLVGLIRRLDRRRFSPHLCTLRPSDNLIENVDCPRLELPTRRLLAPGGIASLRRLADYLRQENIQIVQTFFQDSTALGITAARMARVPARLISFRDLGFWRNPMWSLSMRCLYPWVTGFVANSKAVKNHICLLDHLDPRRVSVIYNGIDTNQYEFREHREGELSIGIVGNLNRRVKRTDLFLRAAARVAAVHPEVSWHVIGDGALRGEYESLAADLGIAERTVFTGHSTDVSTYLHHLTIGVICSDSEGFSNAVLEYMLSGCAVVATAVGGNMEAVRDGVTGLLAPAGNDEALAHALIRLIEDETTRLELMRRARTMVERDFSWEKCVREHEELYQSALLASRQR
ncbi:MAG: glycosyltransferase [Candidatus Eisenbacteria sp.]|nr:glycosyltransferase [Candidatus Eisenbacteria bacterium]